MKKSKSWTPERRERQSRMMKERQKERFVGEQMEEMYPMCYQCSTRENCDPDSCDNMIRYKDLAQKLEEMAKGSDNLGELKAKWQGFLDKETKEYFDSLNVPIPTRQRNIS